MKLRKLFLATLFTLPMLGHTAAPPLTPLAAKSWVLLDFQSGQILNVQDGDKRIEPASLTKLMTAYLTFKALKDERLTLDQKLTVSMRGYKVGGSTMFLEPNTPVSVENLIKGMIVVSGNDACVTLAEGIAGTEEIFAQMMTQEAKRLGMQHTHFTNSAGLPDEEHYTTANDLAILAAAIIRDFPQFYPIYSMQSFAYHNGRKNISQPNRNLLLYRDPFVDGMKTGHTASAGYNLIASSRRDNRRLISVLVGASSENERAQESAKLLNWGLAFFETPKIAAAGQILATPTVWKGRAKQVQAGVLEDVFQTMPKGEAKKLQQSLSFYEPLLAPIKKGQVIGQMKVMADGKVVAERPVLALQAVEKAGFVGRITDSVKLWLK